MEQTTQPETVADLSADERQLSSDYATSAQLSIVAWKDDFTFSQSEFESAQPTATWTWSFTAN